MSAILERPAKPQTEGTTPPPLYNGDRLTRAEFHRRYEAQPDDTKFELIQGVVYAASGMASPLRRQHSRHHLGLGMLVGLYEARTPVTDGGDNATVLLGDESEPQPDLYLRILEEFGGRSRVNDEDYIVGSPELLVEVAHSSVAIDMHDKKLAYQQAGVLEYIVFCIEELELHWFDLASGRNIDADASGVFRSHVFPGLWINSPALVAEDKQGMVRTLERGLASAEHLQFVEQLKSKP